MVIENNKVVLVHYALRDSTAEGQLVESTEGGDPLGYIHGLGYMIPDFEANLDGKKTGDTFAFGIKAVDAYGEYDEEAVTEIPLEAFQLEEGTNPSDVFVEGEVIPLQDDKGNEFMATVIELTQDTLKVDMNHPMAGMDLYFTGHVEAIREATKEELEHGHVHGTGGVTH
jgi:FKBP-type peptidyl-prolyl cis-trans isomerase SlyD